MKILIDVHFDADGVTPIAYQHIDTDDPQVAEMLVSHTANPKAREAGGYEVVTSNPEHKGKTRWEVILHTVANSGDNALKRLLGIQ